jgi:hypothetical protein
MSTLSPAVRTLAGAIVCAGLLAPGTAAVASPVAQTDDAGGFSAPAQRVAQQFSTPRQQTPAPQDGAAHAEAGTTAGASAPDGGQRTDDDAEAAPTRVPSLTDPATGLGSETDARIPEESDQVLVASGADDEATQTHLNLWERTDDGWREDRREGDRTTPAGVFSLSDAGGYLEDPGSQLPYYRDEGLRGGAEAVYGDGYANVFDYVIAIDYNRKTGVAPTENTRPLGWDAGGKIWLHVEHGSPTRGCVALDEEDMRLLLTTLDPDAAPHIAMGSEEFLAQ